MSIALVAFYTKDFEYNALLLKNSALKNGFTHVIMYTPEDIEPLFDPTICKTQRGYGYFGWKPYIILDVISKLEKLTQPVDYLVYCDADQEWKGSVLSLVNLFDLSLDQPKSCLFFYVGEYTTKEYANELWTKKEVFTAIFGKNLTPTPFGKAPQLNAAIAIYKLAGDSNKNFVVRFLKEWLHYCTDTLGLLTDQDIKRDQEIPEFKEHRHDQSIFSLLGYKYAQHCIFTKTPTQYGMGDKTPCVDYNNDPYVLYNHDVISNEKIPTLCVITAVTGRDLGQLDRCVGSIQNIISSDQIGEEVPLFNLEHVLVIDYPLVKDKIKQMLKDKQHMFKKYRIRIITLPINTGKNGWLGHRIYGSIPFLLPHADYISYLDEDNWVDPEHYLSMFRIVLYAPREGEKLFSKNAYSLRKLYSKEGNFIGQDNCESLGHLFVTPISVNPVYRKLMEKELASLKFSADFLIDVNCYLLTRHTSMEISQLWNSPTSQFTLKDNIIRHIEPDRLITQHLLFKNMSTLSGCSMKHTLNYTVGNRAISVIPTWFTDGNNYLNKVYTDFNGKPWIFHPRCVTNNTKPVYLFHFDWENTNTFFEKQHFSFYDSWQQYQMELPRILETAFILKNGFDNVTCLKEGDIALFTLCHVDLSLLDYLIDKKVYKIVYTSEGPNIRHKEQWNMDFLNKYFDCVLTYCPNVLANQKTKPICKIIECPFIYRLNAPFIHCQLNNVYDKSVCMIAECRKLTGEYTIGNNISSAVKYTCLDPLRLIYALSLKNLTVYGSGWDKYKDHRLCNYNLGNTVRSRFEDSTPTVLIANKYTFYLIVENCDVPGYISEKIYDAFVAGAIPLYYGNIIDETIIPKNMYIDLTKFLDVSLLNTYLYDLSVRDLKRFKEAIYSRRDAVLEKVSPIIYKNKIQEIYSSL